MNNFIINNIKDYLFNYDYKKFYGDYEYNNKTYKASNLLFSLLLSERLGLPFVYEENIDVGTFAFRFHEALIPKFNDLELRKKAVSLLKEILDITDQVVKMNGITFSFHEILCGDVDLSDLKSKLKENLNDNMRFSLPYMNNIEKEVVERFKNAKSPITKLIESKARGNQKQLAQQFLAVGYKVDNQSNIIGKPILESLSEGVRDEESFYVQAIGCRNAIVQGTNSVANSGYLNRKLCFGTVDINLSNVKDCGTKNYLEVLITKENAKSVLNGRYVVEDDRLNFVNISELNNYIGKTVKLRSPVTCCCKDGICKTCYGILSQVNKNISIGLLAATSIAEIATQKLLSTKHLLFASIVDDNPLILKYIDISHETDKIICKSKFKLKLTKSGKMFFVDEPNGVNEEFIHSFKHLKIKDLISTIDLEQDAEFEFEENEIVFTGVKDYVNTDMNSLMKTLNRVFEKTSFMKEINDYNEYYHYMLEMLLQIGKLPSVHVEIILSLMMKVENNHSELWRLNQDKELEIVSIRKSNLSNNLFNSILFERVKESLLDLNNYIDDFSFKTKYEKLFEIN